MFPSNGFITRHPPTTLRAVPVFPSLGHRPEVGRGRYESHFPSFIGSTRML